MWRLLNVTADFLWWPVVTELARENKINLYKRASFTVTAQQITNNSGGLQLPGPLEIIQNLRVMDSEGNTFIAKVPRLINGYTGVESRKAADGGVWRTFYDETNNTDPGITGLTVTLSGSELFWQLADKYYEPKDWLLWG